MVDVPGPLKVIGGGLLAVGALAAGAAAGAVAERALVSRTARRGPAEPYGSVRGQAREVMVSDGTVLHVEIDEAPDAPDTPLGPLTVVFSHGYALNLDSWHHQRLALRGKARLVFYDQRSHGRSERAPGESHAIERLGQDLAEVIAAVAPTGPLILVGHSMGGMTIMAMAGSHPDLVSERVFGAAFIASSAGGLTDVTLGFPSLLGQAFHKVAPSAAAALARSKELVELGRRGGSDLTLLLTRLYSFGSLATAQAGQFVSTMIAGTPIDVLAEFFPALQAHDERESLAAFRHAEVVVLVGDRDRLTPMEHSVEIVRHIPGAEFLVVDRAGHMVTLEHPTMVDEALLQLIARVRRNVAAMAA